MPPDSQIIIYQTENGQTKIEVQLLDETVWLSQKAIAKESAEAEYQKYHAKRLAASESDFDQLMKKVDASPHPNQGSDPR